MIKLIILIGYVYSKMILVLIHSGPKITHSALYSKQKKLMFIAPAKNQDIMDSTPNLKKLKICLSLLMNNPAIVQTQSFNL